MLKSYLEFEFFSALFSVPREGYEAAGEAQARRGRPAPERVPKGEGPYGFNFNYCFYNV